MKSVDEVSRLTDEFVDAARGGLGPTVDEFIAQHPSYAAELRPALLAAQTLISLLPAPSLPLVGDSLGEFRLLRLLAVGGMGAIFAAEQRPLGRVVALKVLPSWNEQAGQRNTAVIRFENEIRAASSIDHPHIVPIYAMGQQGRWHYYAMRLIDGADWREWNRTLGAIPACQSTAREAPTEICPLRNESRPGESMDNRAVLTAPNSTPRRDYREIARAVRDIAGALAHAHVQGVLHRDIKPSNLLRDPAGHVWIVDFGLATFPNAAEATATGELVGTCRYMSPEQATSGARVDERSDIYSLGVTFYEMLTGSPAIVADRPEVQLQAVLQAKMVPPRRLVPDLPRDLETIVLKMVAAQPADRYQAAGEVVDELQRWLAAEPIQTRPVSRLQRALRWSRGRSGTILAVAGCLLFMVLGLTLLVSQLLATRRELREQLLMSHLAQAEAHLRSNRPGQQFAAIASLTEAARYARQFRVPAETRHALRRTAITALSLPDARVAEQVVREPGRSLDSSVFAPGLQWACRVAQGELQIVHAAASNQETKPAEIDRIHAQEARSRNTLAPGTEAWPVLATLPLAGELMTACFSADGQRLALLCEPEDQPRLELWDWRKTKRLWSLESEQQAGHPRRFSLAMSAGIHPWFGYGTDDGRVRIHDQTTGDVVIELSGPREPIGQVAFSPDDRSIAASYIAARQVCVWDLTTGERLALRSLPEDTFALAWSRDGRRLAIGTGYNIEICDWSQFEHGEAVQLRGPQEIIANLVFHPDGRWLVSYGYDGKSRIWDTASASLTLELEGHAHRFNPAGDRLAFRTYDRMGIWELALEEVIWHERSAVMKELKPTCLALVRQGDWTVVGGNGGGHVWDNLAHKRLVSLTGAELTAVIAVSAAESVLAATSRGLYEIPLSAVEHCTRGPGAEQAFPWQQLQARQLPLPAGIIPREVAASENGDWIGVTTSNGGVGVLRNRTTWEWLVPQGAHFRFVALSPVGEYLLAAEYHASQVTLWRLGELRQEWPLDFPGGGHVGMGSSQGRDYLFTSGQSSYRGWGIGERGPEWRYDVSRPSGYQKSALAIAPNAPVAIALDRLSTLLVEPLSGSPLETLIDGNQTQRTAALTISPGGTRLAMLVGDSELVVWDLAALTSQLHQLGLEQPAQSGIPTAGPLPVTRR